MDQSPPPPPPSRNRSSNVYHQDNGVDLTLGLGLPEQGSQTLACMYCVRTFSTPQALGGHQNAHREERRSVNSVADSQEVNQQGVANRLGRPGGDLRNGGGRWSYEVGQSSRNNQQGQQDDDDDDSNVDLNLKL